jgi:3-hydroxymyristoyl/3-hydroxydecanoyl-(acyl carrier protein) dehydratase
MTRLLPEILRERAGHGRVELELRVPPDLDYFAGHFPGMPILPGVVQIDWSIRLGRARLPVRGGFVAAEQLKFLSLVTPATELTLTLELNAEEAGMKSGTRLKFGYAGKDRKYSSGMLVFGGP